MVEIYRARRQSSFVPQQASRVPNTGQAIAAGVGQLAGQVAEDRQRDQDLNLQLQEREARRQRSRAAADAMGGIAELQLTLAEQLEEQRKAAEAGAPGHGEAAAEFVREQTGAFLDNLPADDELRDRFAPMLARIATTTIRQEQEWESGRRAQHTADNYTKFQTVRGNQLMAEPSRDGWNSYVTDSEAAIELMDADETTKAALRQDVRIKATQNLLDGLQMQGRYEQMQQLLESGELDAYLPEDAKVRRIARVAEGQRQQQLEIERAANAQLRVAEDHMKALKIRLENEDVPQSEIEAGLQALKIAGADEATLAEYAAMGLDAARSRSVRGAETPELQQSYEGLMEKRRAGELDTKGQLDLTAVEKELDARADTKGESLNTLWRSGPEGQAEAIEALAAMPISERWRVASRFESEAAVLAGLPQRQRAIALHGRQVRLDRGDEFMPPEAADGTKGKDIMRAQFQQLLGPQIVAQMGGSHDDVMMTAFDLMVGSQNGATAKNWNPDAYRRAVNIVFGAKARPDGTWQGGIGTVRGRKIELPGTWSEGEFDRGLARHDFAKARYADGRPAAKADILKHYSIVLDEEQEDGTVLYRFEDARGKPLLRAGDNGIYQLRVRPR